MKLTVSTHKLFGYGGTLRTAKRLAEQAVTVVDRSVPGRMPDVQITLTAPRGMAELATAAEVELTGGEVDKRIQARALREANRHARDAAARAIPLAGGDVLVLVNVNHHANPAEFAVTLVHELVHAMQFSRKGVRERIVTDLRDALGVEKQSRRQAREHLRLLEQEEREAYGVEYLANQLVPAAAA
ncbi:hypothetical protein OHA61_22900 [Streptomyces sp. NBC_00885]|uniref:hypothetical protein n=1 Tax=Streptomyces sp. NBC_00885 TaxID=2975857 RepID=UPI003869D1C1|nr:hypothetical protein OHA61_22900 [Streptomyces sp. NBC_00885]